MQSASLFFALWTLSEGISSGTTQQVLLDVMKNEGSQMRPVAFLHMPKCGGMSVVDALSESGFRNPSVHLFDKALFGEFRDFDTISTNIKLTMRPDFLWDASWDLVTGHMYLSTIRRHFPSARVFTILRDPKSRIISFWSYARSISETAQRDWGTWSRETVKSHVPLLDFLKMPERAPATDNIFTRLLLGPHPRIPIADFINPSDFDSLINEAWRVLASLDFVGVLEDEHLEHQLEKFLQRRVRIPHENVTPPMPNGREIDISKEMTPACLTMIADRIAIDQKLWERVRISSLQSIPWTAAK